MKGNLNTSSKDSEDTQFFATSNVEVALLLIPQNSHLKLNHNFRCHLRKKYIKISHTKKILSYQYHLSSFTLGKKM